MARMKIFNTLEQEAFETAPRFTGAERKRFFAVSVALNDAMAGHRQVVGHETRVGRA